MATLTTISAVRETIVDSATTGARLIVGLTGAPGSGKSTIAAELISALGATAQLLPMDGFHLPQARLVELGRRERMGAPDTFDVDGFLEILRLIRGGGAVLAPGFDRSVEEPVPGAVMIEADARIVLVEGNYLLYEGDGWQASAPLFDLRLYLDIAPSVRLERLMARHVRFGKSLEAAQAWANGPDEANARLIEATASHADHIVRLD